MNLAWAQALPGQPAPLFQALQDATRAQIGHRLFTIMRHDAAAGRNARIHSSHPLEYPVGGAKPLRPSAWTQQLLVEGRPFISENADAIRATFADHATILALGCESVLNLPVLWNGRVLGTVNLLHRTGHYVPHHARIGMALAAWAAPALLDGACPPPTSL
jgi:GAF domain-containing protein